MTVLPVTLTIAYFYWLRALFAPPPPSAVRRPPRAILTHRSPSLIGYTCCHFQNISFLLATTSLYTTSHFPIQSPGAISRSFFSTADWPSGLSLYQSFITIGWERSLRRLPPHLPRSLMAASIRHGGFDPSRRCGFLRPFLKPLLGRQRPESPRRRLRRL